MSLLDFLKKDAVNLEQKEYEIVLEGRLSEQPPIKFKTLTSAEYRDIQNQAIVKGKVKTDKLPVLVVARACTEPNFKDTKAINDLKASTPEGLVQKLLTIGEIQRLATEIIETSGLNVDVVSLEKKVKN